MQGHDTTVLVIFTLFHLKMTSKRKSSDGGSDMSSRSHRTLHVSEKGKGLDFIRKEKKQIISGGC
jgi:hypothetical protein